jgi:hypothetical protein
LTDGPGAAEWRAQNSYAPRKSSAGQTNIGAALSIYRPQFRFTVPNFSIA